VQEPALAAEGEGQSIFSQRLVGLLDDVLEGRAPNAGRFCGYCFHPLPSAGQSPQEGPSTGLRTGLCPYCGRSSTERPTVTRVPEAVFAMYRAQRSREGWAVRGIAWGGLTLGVVLGLLPLAFYGVNWWTLLAFFGLMFLFYVGAANVANSVGDAVGYRWGQAELQRRWDAFVRAREEG
jgi:hypothetical protein